MNAKIVLICLMAVVNTNAYSAAPYRVQLSKKQLRSGDTVDVTIQGLKGSDKIKGFMIQARVRDTPVGKWLVNGSNAYGQSLSCGNGRANAVTHKKIEGDGPNSLTFTWESPPSLAGDVTFRATIALNGGVFWVGVLSPTVSVY